MTLERPIYQLAFELDLEGEPPSVPPGRGEVGVDEARVRLEEARKWFENGEKPLWFDEYENLIRGGWPFRVAMYIAWAAAPRVGRKPETLDGLASLMGLTTPRAIHTWRGKNPAIDQQVALMQAAPLFQHRADLFKAALDVALIGDYKGHNDRKMLFEMLGDYVRRSEVKGVLGRAKDLEEMSEAELRGMLGGSVAGDAGSVEEEEGNDAADDG